jgi:class 3 adenylate cyclase
MNQAARLCAAASGGEVLASDRFVAAVETLVQAETVGELELKGFRRPVMTHKVLRLRT